MKRTPESVGHVTGAASVKLTAARSITTGYFIRKKKFLAYQAGFEMESAE